VEYQVSLPVFEGPFALLFHLIEKAEVDIYEISISEITAQYLAYLQAMQKVNLELASEFLVMAATLLKLKSKKLLPVTVESAEDLEELNLTIDSREELVQRLLEYRHFKAVATELRSYEQAQKRVFVRSLSGGKVVLVNPAEEAGASAVALPGLVEAFQRLLAKREQQPHEIAPDDFSVHDKVKYIMKMLRGKKEGVDFLALFPRGAGLSEIIVTFFALLELVRIRKIRVWQSDPFGSLLVAHRQNSGGGEGVN
jgi:segregation and condensation protein A